MPKRTTHRSTAGKKLYAVRDKSGKFEDIQTYERAHGQDVKRKAKREKLPAHVIDAGVRVYMEYCPDTGAAFQHDRDMVVAIFKAMNAVLWRKRHRGAEMT